MEQDYALDWFDQMVDDLGPETDQGKILDLSNPQLIISTAGEEHKRLILYLKRIAFKKNKTREIEKLINGYFNTTTKLINRVASKLVSVADEYRNLQAALKSILICLKEIHTFIVNRYSLYLNLDNVVEPGYLQNRVEDLQHLETSGLLKINQPLSQLIRLEFRESLSGKLRHQVTLRTLDYWESIERLLDTTSQADRSREDCTFTNEECFDKIELMLIERNFNSPRFVKYLTSKILAGVDEEDAPPGKLRRLVFFQKSFNQIPLIKQMIYDVQYDDLALTINSWFTHEIAYQSKFIDTFSDEKVISSPNTIKYSRKITDKVLCNLTVDQLALLFKAADESKIIVARSLSAVFQAVAPYLSTPNREEISCNSLRVKSYSIEDRDRQLLLEWINRLTKQIQNL